MIFNVSAYLNNDSSIKEIKDYNKYVSNGILLDEEILYLLIVGDFVIKQKNKETYLSACKTKFNIEDFNYTVQFLRGFKTNLFITPHIFTKFIHLLWENVRNIEDYEEIIKGFYNASEFIQEKHLDKKYFFEEENFKKKRWDLINSSLILSSKNYECNTILTCRWKTNNICNECGCLVIHYENIKSAYLTNYFN